VGSGSLLKAGSSAVEAGASFFVVSLEGAALLGDFASSPSSPFAAFDPASP